MGKLSNSYFYEKFEVLEENVFSATAVEEYAYATIVRYKSTGYMYRVIDSFINDYNEIVDDYMKFLQPDDDEKDCALLIVKYGDDIPECYVAY